MAGRVVVKAVPRRAELGAQGLGFVQLAMHEREARAVFVARRLRRAVDVAERSPAEREAGSGIDVPLDALPIMRTERLQHGVDPLVERYAARGVEDSTQSGHQAPPQRCR